MVILRFIGCHFVQVFCFLQNAIYCWQTDSWNQKTHTLLCPRVKRHLLLTNDAVEHVSQCFEVFQDEHVLLVTFLWGQGVQLIFFHLLPNAKYIDIWKHTHKCTYTVCVHTVIHIVMLKLLHSVKVSVGFLSWYPALSHLCDRGMCCGSPADSGSGPGQSEAWSLCWSNLRAERHKDDYPKDEALLHRLCDISGVFTVCFYNDDVLGLIKMVPGTVLPEEVDHLTDTVQGSVEVGARLTPMACRWKKNAKD